MNELTSPDILIVGGGPAGLAAAEALLAVGQSAQVLLVEEGPSLGGQFYKQYQAGLAVPRGRELDQRFEVIRQLTSRLSGPNLEIRTGCLVWGLSPAGEVGIVEDERASLITPRATILALGAYERPAVFPGWTLPGVVQAGALQTLLRREAILPGTTVLLAGTGPFLLTVAAQLLDAGAEVVAVLDSSPAPHSDEAMSYFLSEKIQLHSLLGRLRIRFGYAVARVEPDGAALRVMAVPVDAQGEVVPGEELTYTVDSIGVHSGFVPALELAQMAGAEIEYAEPFGGWHVAHDAGMRAGRPGLYVAGQIAGIGGALLAEATGRLAGLSAALDLGLADPEGLTDELRHLSQRIERGRALVGPINQASLPNAGLAGLITPETILCRCEEVSAAQVETALAQGARTLNDVKRHSRCGMGRCQGRICAAVLPPYLERVAAIEPGAAGSFNARPPLKPLPLAVLASLTIDRRGERVEAGRVV